MLKYSAFVGEAQILKIKLKLRTNRHPFNGLFSNTTWISWHHKGYTNLDFNEAREDGVAVASAGPYHLHLPPDR